MNGGIIEKTERGTYSYLEAEIKEKVNLAYQEWKMDKESGGESVLEDVVENRLNESYGEESVDVSKQGKGILVKVTKSGKEHEYTLIDDGTVADGKIAYLDIADGCIDLRENGYVQGVVSNIYSPYGELRNTITGEFIQGISKYIITGTTTDNMIQISEKGNYDITIKDLSIDVSGKSNGYCAFIANRTATYTNVVINIEGNNYLKSYSGAGLSFSTNISNINGENSGSTLTLQGNGKLETIGGSWSAGIGGNYSGRNSACNITINSGTIIATGNGHGAGIGGALRR